VHGRTSSGRGKKVTAIAYIRTSTKTNKDRGGKARATRAIAKAWRGPKIDGVVHDVLGGCIPASHRKLLTDLLEKKVYKNLKTIVVEGTRDLARSMIVAEDLLQLSKKYGVKIVSVGDPGLLEAEETPTQKLTRRMKFLFDEYDRDNIRYKLQNGIDNKMKTTKSRTQHGRPKVAGRKSILDEKMTTMSRAGLNKLRKLFQDRSAGKMGWRPLAVELKKSLRLKTVPGHETARRIGIELAQKFRKI
jgi:DNA invertase Pin-like site-specific DNA recombinase